MEEERKLYPMSICSILDERAWGSDEFHIADLGYRDSLVKDGWLAGNSISEVMDTYMDRVVGENVFEYNGRQFPVCVKTISCKGRLPLQVHPNDTTAADCYDFLGKDKIWYVLEAGKDAKVYLGFAKDCDASELLCAAEDGTVEKLLNARTPEAGECIRIAPGTVHALSGDVKVLEVSESSPMDFCLYAWGNELGEDEFDPAFSIVEALDFIDFKAYRAPEECGCGHHHHEDIIRHLVSLPQFSANLVNLTDPLHIYTEKFASFILYTCIKGEASIQQEVLGQKSVTLLKAGQTVLVPEEVEDFILAPLATGTQLVEVLVEHREDPDAYINPNAAAHLDDDDDDCGCCDDDCGCCDDDCDDDCCHDEGECHCGRHHHHS